MTAYMCNSSIYNAHSAPFSRLCTASIRAIEDVTCTNVYIYHRGHLHLGMLSSYENRFV